MRKKIQITIVKEDSGYWFDISINNLLAVNRNGKIDLWNVNNSSRIYSIDMKDIFEVLVFSVDGNKLYGFSQNDKFFVWDVLYED